MIFWSSLGGPRLLLAAAARRTSTRRPGRLLDRRAPPPRGTGRPPGRPSMVPASGGRKLEREGRALARAATRPRCGRPCGGRARGRCRGRGRCRRRRGSGPGRGGRTSRRSAAARGGMPSPWSRDREADAGAGALEATISTRPPSGEYLTALSIRFPSTWRTLSGSAATARHAVRRSRASSTAVGSVRRGGLEHALARARRRRSARSRPARAGVEPARPEDVVDDAGEPVRLARDHAEQARRAAPRASATSGRRSVIAAP